MDQVQYEPTIDFKTPDWFAAVYLKKFKGKQEFNTCMHCLIGFAYLQGDDRQLHIKWLWEFDCNTPV